MSSPKNRNAHASPDSGNNLPAPEAVIRDMIAVQREQAALRKTELEKESEQNKLLYDYNTRVLDRQGLDRHEARLSRERLVKWSIVAIFLVVLVLAGVVSLAIFVDKDEIAKRIIELVFTFLGGSGVGGVVGFSYGKKNKNGKSGAEDQ